MAISPSYEGQVLSLAVLDAVISTSANTVEPGMVVLTDETGDTGKVVVGSSAAVTGAASAVRRPVGIGLDSKEEIAIAGKKVSVLINGLVTTNQVDNTVVIATGDRLTYTSGLKVKKAAANESLIGIAMGPVDSAGELIVLVSPQQVHI